MALTDLCVYGIGIKHPEDWKIYLNPNKPFSKESGFIKIDDIAAASGQPLSLAIRWEKCLVEKLDIEGYTQSLKEGLQKKFKQKLNLKEIKFTDIFGHRGSIIHFSYSSNHQIYAFLGKEETVEQVQVAVFCDVTQRIVVANLSTTPDNFAKKQEMLYPLLFSLRCH